MKKVRIILPMAFISLLSLSSCLKEHDVNVSTEEKTATFVSLQFLKDGGTTVNSGLQYFAGAALTYSPTDVSKTEKFNVSVNGPDNIGNDLAVTIAVDPTKVLDNLANDNISYELMPDSVYSLSKTAITIPANVRAVPVEITFYPSKVNPTKSYMLPITVKSADGRTISRNFGTIYFHIIGNVLAGVYDVVGTRYNYSGLSGYAGGAYPANYVGTAASPSPKNASPSSPSVIRLDYANLGGNGYQYVITYDESKPTEIEVAANSTLAGAVSNFTVWVANYNPATKQIHIVTSYNNAAGGAGNDRIIDERFTHR